MSVKYDYKTLYEKSAAFYEARPLAKRILLRANLVLTAVFFLAYGGLIVWGVAADFSPKDLIKILAIPAFCLIAVAATRMMLSRPRPYSAEGANIVPLLHKKSGDKESFPSRHLACAFIISVTFLPYLAWAGICLLLLGLALGYVRFALGLHYPTDLIGGAALGLLCGLFLLI